MFSKKKMISKLFDREFLVKSGVDNIKSFLDRFDPNTKISEITTKDIEEFVTETLDKGGL